MEKDCFYFSHDYNARTDVKTKNLLRKHGMRGYGIYWAIVEDLYNNANLLETDYDGIAYDLHESVDIVKSVINDFDLFVIDGNAFGSESVERRLNKRNEKSKKASLSASYRWLKKRENANAKAKDANALNTNAEAPKTDADAPKNDAIKESKGKDNKENKNKEYKKSLLSEVNTSDFPELQSDYVDAAKAFHLLFRQNLIEAGATPVNIDKAKGSWVDDIRLIIEVDNYTMDDLRDIYKFLQENDFWKKNILSTSKLREKMDKLKLNQKHEFNRTNTKEGTSWNKLAEIVAESYNN